MNRVLKLIATVSFLVSAAYADISVSSPANGSNVGTPVHVVANANSSYPIVAMKVYVDHNVVYSTGSNTIDTNIEMASGWRNIVVQSWDSTGAVQKYALSVNVTYSTTSQPVSGTSGITVSSPANGSTSASPVHVAASSPGAIAMKVYVDNNLAFSAGGAGVDTYLAMATGTRYVVVQSWDSTGAVLKQAVTVNVSGTTSAPAPTGNAFTDIEQLTGWEHCDSCAGIGGVGPSIPYSYTQGRVDPSMDGNSMEFWIGGDNPYSNALWWKQLGPQDGAANFVYDLNYYIKDPNAAQALEFDVNQSVNGRKFIFGTECNIAETRTWRVWDPANYKWVNSGVPCAKPTAYQWHRVTWEFKREGNDVFYIAVTVDGQKSYVNRQFTSLAVSARELNVAFQMDGNYNQTDYSVWLDKVTLNYW
ncbi:MAG TPA: hypothetical protein VMZ25_03730 [Terriglobales bacterium]|nr:hypothetical protein [Terriglobales bacterium]